MPMIQLIEQIPCAAPRQNQGGADPAVKAWRSSDLNAENLAHLSESNLKTIPEMGLLTKTRHSKNLLHVG
jgi:hypothetical protein